MGFKKLLSTILVCGLVSTSLAVQPVDVNAADPGSVFNSVNLAKSYKSVSNNNPIVTQKFSADPGVMEYNGRIYVYATNDGSMSSNPGFVADNTYAQINQINVMSSADMVNWTDHGSINVAGSNGAARWAGNSWAPTACHKKINGKEKFFLYFANNANGIGVLTADSPTGPWRDPIGKALISRQTPNCGNVTWLFDPAVLVDDDGTGYLYFGGGVPSGQAANPKTARVVKLGNDMTSLAGTPQMIDAPWLFEDSGINKIGNTYYYSYCINWSGGPYGNAKIGYMTSNNPMGPFTFKGTCFNNPGDFFGTVGNNHHTIIEFKGKQYIFYHAEWLNKQAYGSQKGYRTTHVDVMPFSNGSFGQAKGTLTGVSQLQTVNPFVSQEAASMAWQGGINVYGTGDTVVAYNRGDWTGVSDVAFGSGAKSITMRAASQNGAWIKVCTGSANGPVAGYVEIPATGSTSNYKNVTASMNNLSGTKDLFFVASGDVVIDNYQFSSNGGSIDLPDPTVEPTSQPIQSGKVADGWYYIKNVGSQKYLQVAGNTGKTAQNVEISTGTGAAGQKWYVANNADGYFTLKSALGDFMVDIAYGKDEDGANVQIYDGYGGEAQQFMVRPINDNGVFAIGTRCSGGTKMLDVYNHATEDGTNVCQWTYGGRPNQQWIFEPVNTQPAVSTPAPTPAPTPTPTAKPTATPSTAAPTVAPTQTPAGNGLPAGVTAEYKIVSDWGGSFQGEIVLTNKSGKALNGWTLNFDYNCKITNLWGADFVGQTGTKVVVKNPSWSADLASASSVTIDFIADGIDKSAPTNYSLK